jgi:hypothetical protein
VKQHPCWNWCAGRLRGIVENLNLTRDSEDQELDVTITSVRRPVDRDDDRGIVTLVCQHGRLYLLELRQAGHDD